MVLYIGCLFVCVCVCLCVCVCVIEEIVGRLMGECRGAEEGVADAAVEKFLVEHGNSSRVSVYIMCIIMRVCIIIIIIRLSV